MKPKKDKNASVQISLYSIFDEISRPQHMYLYKDNPNLLADQIEDLITLLNFAASNYTNKARTFLNLTKEFTKSIEVTLQTVNELDAPLYRMPQSSYPELVYETLKRCSRLGVEEENEELDWRAVHTEYQLKFMESKNIAHLLEWEKCYNSHERCIQIRKSSAEPVSYLSRQSLLSPLQIDLGLKIQNNQIVWQVKKVIYHNNMNSALLSYYQNNLMKCIRQHHNSNIEESEKHVLSLLYKSIDYVDIILLFIELKNLPFNLNPDHEADHKNGILDLFDQNDLTKYAYLKGKNIKVCFLLPYSNYPPSLIIRIDGLNVLKIQISESNQIVFKAKLKYKEQEMTLKKMFGSIKKRKLGLGQLLEIVHEIVRSLETYEKLVAEKVDLYKMDIFVSNRTTNLLIYLKTVNCVLVEDNISKNESVNMQIKHDLSTGQISLSGLYLVFTSLSHTNLPPLISYISFPPDLLIKTSNTEFGFINMMFKKHPAITFEQAMYHVQFLQQIQTIQQKSNWNVKLVYVDIYSNNQEAKDEYISYKFKQLATKKYSHHNLVVKRDTKQDLMAHMRDYSFQVKIHENFKSVQFVFVNTSDLIRAERLPNSNTTPEMVRNQIRQHEKQISQKYFKNTWRQYMKRRNESEMLKNQYLDIDQLLKATHYILNHLDFNWYIKAKSGIFKTEDMVQLMDH